VLLLNYRHSTWCQQPSLVQLLDMSQVPIQVSQIMIQYLRILVVVVVVVGLEVDADVGCSVDP